MGYQVDWSQPAQEQLRAIWDYIASDNPLAADELRETIFEKTALLEEVPRIGARFPGPVTGEVRHLIVGRYRIFYEIHEALRRIDILSIRHSACLDPEF